MATPPSPSLPQPSPFKKSRVRVSSSLSQIHHPWIPLLLLAILFSSVVSPSSPAKIPPYSDHCSSTVPESIPDGMFIDSHRSFRLLHGYFSGGDTILRRDPNPSSTAASSGFLARRSCNFHTRSMRRTRTPGVLQVEGILTFLGEGGRMADGNLTMGRSRRPIRRGVNQRKFVNFHLSGFWSESTGKLCMVGTGFARSKGGDSLDLSAVFKLNYPATSNISTSLVTGTVESLDSDDGSNHFDPISVLVYAQNDYQYTQLPQVRESCSGFKINEESLGFHYSSSCSYLMSYLGGVFKLENMSDCSSRNCGPFTKDLGFSPRFMSFNHIQCSDGGLHMYMGFPNVSYFEYNSILVPENSLVGEGFWDQKSNRLCLLACRILNTKNSLANASTGDCTIGFSVWFPSVLSIKKRSTAVGRIWSNRHESDSSYFSTVSFRSLESNFDIAPGLKYKYTQMDEVRKACPKSSVPNSGKRRYPDGKSIRDMVFDGTVRNTEGNHTWVSATPLSIGETFYANPYAVPATPLSIGEPFYADPYTVVSTSPIPPTELGEMNYSIWNVSYKIKYTFPYAYSNVFEPTEISAEGIYNSGTGLLCMVGCQYSSSSLFTKQVRNVDSMDCGILVNIQLAPLNPEGEEYLKGTIMSTRAKTDPLYFKPLEVSSQFMYATIAGELIWRMDVEITIVLISLTLTCIFIGLQLFHVKKYPDVLPSISIMMLVTLTLGYMIPLVLNFEALFFMNRNRHSVMLGSGGWLEVNEVVVRVMTMIAFLLQFRLLQIGWSARSAAEGKKGLWAAERNVIKLFLPLFIAGGLIAWFIDLRSYGTQPQSPDLNVGRHRSLWEVLISCAGLILDGFLLPQIILNIFLSSKDKALSPFFYIGTTVVRATPHLYDAYRARHYFANLESSYIYASPGRDFYSTAWDIIIPCQGMLFAAIIYLQQRFGGGCILPPRFRKTAGYETVSEIGL